MRIFDPRDYGANPNDNIDDTKSIQAALDAARDAGGGHVILEAGTYIISGTGTASDGALRIYSNTEISGAGMGETILKIADGWASKITGMIRTPVNQVTTDVVIRDLTLDGNRDMSTADIDGIMTGVLPGKAEHDDRILIERVEIHDVSRIAFNPHEQTQNLTIRDCVAHHNSWDGFIADFVSNSVYENNVAYANDRHGFNVVTHSHDLVLRNNVAYDNAENGMVVQRGAGSKSIDGWEDMLNHDVLLEGNTVYDNGKNGILFKQAENSQVINNIIYGNGDDGIQLEGANEIIVDGNIIQSSTIFGIEIRPYTGSLGGPGESYDNVIINNVITAVQKAFVESGSTTMDNVFAENLIGDLGFSLGKTATLSDDSVTFTYDKLEFTVSIPHNYVDTDMTTPEPLPVIDEVLVGHDITDVTPPPAPTEEATPEPLPTPEPVPEPAPVVSSIVKGEFLSGDSGSNTINGTLGNDTIKGRDGHDKLYGGAGDDYLEGNDGNDTLYGGAGKDTMKGSSGDDTFVFMSLSEAGEGDVITDFSIPNEKLDISNIVKDFVGFTKSAAFTDGYVHIVQDGKNVNVFLDKDGTAGSEQEVLLVTLNSAKSTDLDAHSFIMPDVGAPTPAPISSSISSSITTTSDSLSGTSNNDSLYGSAANDTLKGGRGHDILIGNDGNDTLWGNDGNDILYGGKGSDWMKGGDGADRFIVDANLGGIDTIRDLRLNSGDTLEIKNILGFDELHDDIADFVHMTTNGKNTIVSVDLDGTDNGSHFTKIAEIIGVTGLDASKMYDDGHLLTTHSDVI